MIDYHRLERGASGVVRRAPEHIDVDERAEVARENARLRQVIDVQKAEINRLMRLLGIGLLQK